MEFVMIVIGIIIGVFSTAVYVQFINSNKLVGTLRIDNSDQDDGPYLFVELSVDPAIMTRKKQILLNVSTENYISQK